MLRRLPTAAWRGSRTISAGPARPYGHRVCELKAARDAAVAFMGEKLIRPGWPEGILPRALLSVGDSHASQGEFRAFAARPLNAR